MDGTIMYCMVQFTGNSRKIKTIMTESKSVVVQGQELKGGGLTAKGQRG